MKNFSSKTLPPGSVPFQPWAEALYNQRRATLSKDDPTGWCVPGGVPRSNAVPYPFKIVHTPVMTVILYEAVQSYRQIFTDGRALPKDPNPAWLGYSIGRWEKDAFVVESAGFNDNVWLDNFGHPATEQLKVTERFVRKDFGNMDIEVTIDDPKAYTKPWKVVMPLRYVADADLIGLPVRVTVGKKTLEDGNVDVRDRKTGAESRVAIAALPSAVKG